MASSIYIGIDPGLSGAVAVIDGDRITLFDVPTRKATRGEVYLAGEMADLLRPYSGAFCIVEDVALRPGESGRNGLKIGRGAGLWEGILAAHQIAYEIVASARWKKDLRLADGSLSDTDRKKAARARAQELFPELRGELGKRRPDFSEALLLAEWGRRRR